MSININSPLTLYGQTFNSRFLLGTSRYPSPEILEQTIRATKPAMVTASLRRQGVHDADITNNFWTIIKRLSVPVLPNTAGCHSIKEVIATAKMAREIFETDWIKLELIGDDYTLQPNTLEIVEAARALLKDGFKVLPYCTDDLVVCLKLADMGCQALMPWAAPIGTGKGPINPYALQILRDRIKVPMIIDAGIGKPSHACQVMEWGYDAVLLNTAVALSQDPVRMGIAFSEAIDAGRTAHLSGLMIEQQDATASTPTLGTPFWTHEHD